MKATPRPEATIDDRAITTWLSQAMAAGWRVLDQPSGWRLERTQRQSHDLPSACEARLWPGVLEIAAAVRLPVPLACVRQALALFLLRQGGRHRVRPLLDDEKAVLSVTLPLAGLETAHLADALAVVTAAYPATHREILALADPDPALRGVYLSRVLTQFAQACAG